MKKLGLILFFLIIISCKKELPDEEKDIIEFIKNEENGFSQYKEINGVKLSVIFRPAKLMVLQESNNCKNQKDVDALKKKYSKSLCFIIGYSKNNQELLSAISESRDKFNFIQNKLTFEMKDYVSLLSGKDTIPLLDFNFPRTYGMSKSTNIVFVFDKNKLSKRYTDTNFNIKDIGLGIGDVNFKFNTSLLLEN